MTWMESKRWTSLGDLNSPTSIRVPSDRSRGAIRPGQGSPRIRSSRIRGTFNARRSGDRDGHDRSVDRYRWLQSHVGWTSQGAARIEAAAAGGGELAVRAAVLNDAVEVSIADTGVG